MITRPKPGQIWAFRTPQGRRDTIKSVQSGLKPVTVRELWQNWVFVR